MRPSFYLAAAALLALAGCASVAPDAAPAVSVINSLTYDNAISGQRDGERTAWPLAGLARSSEPFPMAQVKQCDADGARCSWGVMKAQRSFGKVTLVPGGVSVELEVAVEVDRSLRNKNSEQDTTMTIPANVGALQAKRVQKRSMVLEFGKVTRIDFNYGISYEVCAQRQALDQCALSAFYKHQ
jgi:hypothetical protein